MSRFFKSALFPILIVIVLAFFASKLISRSDQAPARSFAGFLEQVENGQVQTATLRTKDNSIDVRLKGTDKNKYQVGYPVDYDYGFTWFHESEWIAGNRRSVCWAKTSQ